MIKYSKNFERDFNWYLSVRHNFNFDARQKDFYNKKIIYDKKGISAKEAFFILDSSGKILPTKHPKILKTLLKVKASVNLHIKILLAFYPPNLTTKQDCFYLYCEALEWCQGFKAPFWVFKSILNARKKMFSPVLFESITTQ